MDEQVKLLVCRSCTDVFSLRHKERTCSCGLCGGRYVDDLEAEVWGPDDGFWVLGFENSSLSRAIRDQITLGDRVEVMGGVYGDQVKGREFNAFIIPESARTVVRRYTDVQ
jgi:hypothetical protein